MKAASFVLVDWSGFLTRASMQNGDSCSISLLCCISKIAQALDFKVEKLLTAAPIYNKDTSEAHRRLSVFATILPRLA
jgi:hypothetical protein